MPEQNTINLDELLLRFVEQNKQIEKLTANNLHLKDLVDRERNANKAFVKASKAWNTVVVQGKVISLGERSKQLVLEQGNLTFNINLSDKEIEDKIYKYGDMLLVVGVIRVMKEDEEDDGYVDRGAITVDPSRITIMVRDEELFIPE